MIAQGGEYWYGVAYTTNSGVTPVGAVYRDITIKAGYGNYTVGAVEYDTLRESHPAVIRGRPRSCPPDRHARHRTVDSTPVSIDAGAANANKTLTVGSFPAGLDRHGAARRERQGTIDASAIPVGPGDEALPLRERLHQVLAAWGTFTLTGTPPLYSRPTPPRLTAEVASSNRFELVAPVAATVNLGATRRNQTTAPVALGQFTVFDDRDVLSGWNLNVTPPRFAGPGGTTVPANALGYSPVGGPHFRA